MTQPLGELSITSSVPTQKVVQFGGIKGVIIGNESALTVDITMQGTVQGGTLYPETIDFFPVRQGFNGNILIKPRTLLGNPLSYVSSLLSFDVVGKNEKINLSAYPIALTRPAVSPTASGKGQGLFTATFGSINTASTVQALNIFNPL